MKRYFFGLLSLVAVLSSAFAIFFHPPAVFADVSSGDIPGATYKFQDRANIIATFGSATVTFKDSKVNDGTNEYTPTSSDFCADYHNNITIAHNANWSNSSIPAKLDVEVKQGQTCSSPIQSSITISNPGQVANYKYEWNGNDISTLPGQQNSGTWSSTSNAPNYYANGSSFDDFSACDKSAILLTSGSQNSGTLYCYTPHNCPPRSACTPVNLPDPIKNYAPNGYTVSQSLQVNILGTPGSTPPGGGGGGGTPYDPNSSCINNGGTTLEWLFCPLTTAIGKTTDAMNGFIENQLDFSTSEFLPDSGPNAGAHLAWNILKDIVSSALIILLLVMVISQAVGGNFIEAYTVKKVLPRIIIAVILMQISWYLCTFAINFVDHIGNGIRDIIAAPFGGPPALTLNALLGKLGSFWGGAAQFSIAAALVTATFLAVGNPAGALLVAFSLVLCVLIALLTILFRNVLILALVILSPLAILLWTMPGGGFKKYWDMWKDNFLKILMLFPLIVSVIYAGRIFAWIAAGQGSHGFLDFMTVIVGFFGPYAILPKTFKWGGSLMSQASEGASTIMNKGFGEKGKKWLGEQKEARKGINEYNATRRLASGQYKGFFNREVQRRVDRITTGTTPVTLANRIKFQRTILDKAEEFKKEDVHRATLKLMNQILPQYDRSSHDAIREAIVMEKGPITVKLANGSTGTFDPNKDFHQGATGYDKEVDIRAALDRAVIHSQFRAVEHYIEQATTGPHATKESRQEATEFLDANAGVLGDKMTHLLKGMGVASSSSPEGIAKMRGEEVESILSTLTTTVNDASKSDAERTEAATRLSTFLQNYAAAASNDQLKGQLNQTGARAVKAFITNNATVMNDINSTRNNYGLGSVTALPGVQAELGSRLTPAAVTGVNTALANLNSNIDDAGVVK